MAIPLLIASALIAAAAVRPEARAKQASSEALKLAEGGKLSELFEEATRLVPTNANYWNNVGVAYMRSARMVEAVSAFRKSLRLNGAHPDAKDNLRDAIQYLARRGEPEPPEEDDEEGEGEGEGDDAPAIAAVGADGRQVIGAAASAQEQVDPEAAFFAGRTAGARLDRIRHRVRPIPRIPAQHMHLAENWEYARGLKPFILTEAVPNIAAVQAWLNATWLMTGPFGDATVDFYPRNMAQKDVHPFLVPLREAVGEMLNRTDSFPYDPSHPGRYIHWNLRYGHWRNITRLVGPLQLVPFMDTTDRWLTTVWEGDDDRSEFQVRHGQALCVHAASPASAPSARGLGKGGGGSNCACG